MLRLTSKKTLPILLYMLDNTRFTQSQIRDDIDISIGRVNKIAKFLIDKGIVIKSKAKYELVQPNRLSELIANTYEIVEHQTFFLDINKSQLMKILKNTKSMLCLESALDSHVKEFKSPSIQVYHNEKLVKALNQVTRGKTKLIVYKQPYQIQAIAKTNKPLTVIDLIAAGKTQQAQILSERIWNTRQ